MDVVGEILERRDEGVVRCGRTGPASDVVDVARAFGLRADAATYREVDADEARRVASYVLGRGLAYDNEVVPLADAWDLAGRFVGSFGDARWYTNGSWAQCWDRKVAGDPREGAGAGWNPATKATFDTGILALSPTESGCLWVEDED